MIRNILCSFEDRQENSWSCVPVLRAGDVGRGYEVGIRKMSPCAVCTLILLL